ncbi:hypothetical protein M5E87_28870 [Flavonifractor plautii]|nr:hypothetical protein M5E87_28870 [Flavonifractor plautii]
MPTPARSWPVARRCGPTWASAPTEVCCGRHCPAKMLRRGGACPRLRAAIKAAPTSGARLRRAVLRRLDVGAGVHTRPELAGGPEVRADVGIGPYRGLLRQAPPGQNAP